MNDSDKIEALKIERTGYLTRGLDDRAAQVEDELRVLGALPPKAKRAEKPAPKGK